MKVKRDSTGCTGILGAKASEQRPRLFPIIAGVPLFPPNPSLFRQLLVHPESLHSSPRVHCSPPADCAIVTGMLKPWRATAGSVERQRMGRLLTMLELHAWRLAQSRVFAPPRGRTSKAAVEKRLSTLVLVGNRPALGIPKAGNLRRGTCARIPNVGRKQIAILRLRLADRPGRASPRALEQRALEPIDGAVGIVINPAQVIWCPA